MKREANAIHHPVLLPSNGQFVRSMLSVAKPPLAKFGKAMSALVVNIQISRMISVLQSMSDRQLEEIGITRAEITKYAKTLVTEDGCTK